MRNNIRRESDAHLDHADGRFVLTEDVARRMAYDASRRHAATIARNAAAEGLTVAAYLAIDPFAAFA